MCGDIWILTHKVTINLSFNSQLRRIIQIGPVYIESSFKATYFIRERCKKKGKKLTNVSFMYVCEAENGEMLVCFLFSPNNSLIDNSLSE